MSSDSFFRSMQDAAKVEQTEQQQMSFQERIVKRILRHAGIPINIGQLKGDAKERRGTSDIGFDWLYEAYPEFPVRMFSQKIPYTHKATLADLYGQGRFRKLPWWKEYIAFAELNEVDLRSEHAALVFNLPHAQDAFLMVLHNQPIQATIVKDAECRQDEHWPRTTFPMRREGLTAVLESFSSFMQTVGVEWSDQLI